MKGSPKSGAEENTFIKAYEELEKSGKTPIRGPEAFPLLEIVHGPKQGAWFTVAYQKEITLGRAASNSIVLEDNSVSRSHAVLQMSGEGYTVRDIGSRNGTFLNTKKIQGEVPIHHLDTVKVGIYTLRFLEEPTEQPYEYDFKEEHTPRVEEALSTTGTGSHGIMTEEMAESQHSASAPEPEPMPAPAPEPIVQPKAVVPAAPQQVVAGKAKAGGTSRALRNLLILLLIFGVLGGGAYTAFRKGLFKKLQVGSSGTKTPPAKTEDKNGPKVVTPPVKTETPPVAAGQLMPIFIEVDAKPVPAKIIYKGKELGLTPFKISIQVPPGQPQELVAEYFLEGIGQKWTEKTNFQAAKQDEVVPVTFQAKLGRLNVKALPKTGNLYLEGKTDPTQTEYKPLTLSNVTFDTPIYLPYGKYVAEVKMSETLDGSSSSTVNSVKYRREFEVSEAAPEFTIQASDEAIKTFPAKIGSDPTGAELDVDGKKIGDTPFEGDIPTGRHKLTLKKEGFNPLEKEINIELNTPYQATYNLNTTAAGEFINKGRTLVKKAQYNEAIEQFAEALKHNPDADELAQVHVLLGEAFVETKTFDQALAYYQKAKENPQYANQSELGMASAYAGLGQNDQALVKVINVMINSKDSKVQSDAESLYHKIYPMKSVLYIATQPDGANVSINGNAIAQLTPVILSDLLVGSYRVKIEKAGFKPYEIRVNLAMSAVKPLVINLEAQP